MVLLAVFELVELVGRSVGLRLWFNVGGLSLEFLLFRLSGNRRTL